MDSPPPRVARLRFSARLGTGLAVMSALAYLAVLAPWIGAHAGASDSSGYMNQARLIVEGTVSMSPREVEGAPPSTDASYLYVPLGFRPVSFDPPRMVPTYPVGLSLFVAAASSVLGWTLGPTLVVMFHLAAALGVVYALGRTFALGAPWAVLGAILVGLSPLTVFMGLQMMSDLPSLVWVTAAVVLAEWARERGATWAAGAGLALALAVLLRPTNLLMILPLAWALGGNFRRWLAFGLGGLPGAVFLLLYTWHAYGSFVTTGYGDVSNAFKSALILPTLLHYGYWLPLLLTPVVVLALGLPWRARGDARRAGLLATWMVVLLGLYSAYDHTHETWWYLRFVLPTFPALVVAALLTLQALAARWAAGRPWAPGAYVALVIFVGWFSIAGTNRLHAHYGGRQEALYPELCAWARTHLPPDAVVVAMQATGALLYSTEFTFVRWDHAPAAEAARVQHAAAEARRPLYAILFDFEEDTALAQWQPERWQRIGQVDHVSIWRQDIPRAAPEAKPR